jgi:translation initiation factor eIF-2B subunit alpha
MLTDGTLQELSENLRRATEEMKKADYSTTSVQSGCELFQRFITLATLDQPVIKFILHLSCT